MSVTRELERMQQSIREMDQCLEALKNATDRLTPPEYPNELREPDEASKRFYREPDL